MSLVSSGSRGEAAAVPPARAPGTFSNAVPFVWLTNAPLVNKIVFKLTTFPADAKVSTLAFSELACEGGLRNDSWYLLTRRPAAGAADAGEYFGGESNTIWTLSADRGMVRVQTMGATNGAAAQLAARAREGKNRLEDLLRFGVPECTPGTLAWNGQRDFTFRTVTEAVRGTVDWDREGRVQTVRYQSNDATNWTGQIHYRYKTAQDRVPEMWIIERDDGPGGRLRTACTLQTLELAGPGSESGGFHFRHFLPTNSPPILIIESNGIPMAINSRSLVGQAPPQRAYMNPQKANRRYITLLGGLAALNLLFPLIQMWQCRYPRPRPAPAPKLRERRPAPANRHPRKSTLARHGSR